MTLTASLTRDPIPPSSKIPYAPPFVPRPVPALALTVAVLGTANLLVHTSLLTPSRAQAAQPPSPDAHPTLAKAVPPSSSRFPSTPAGAEIPSFAALPPIRIESPNAQASLTLKLYDAFGYLDESNARRLDALLADTSDPDHPVVHSIARRTLQLLYRAAYHFDNADVIVISGHRAPRRRPESPHASGRAIDFKLEGVKAAKVASYLRKLSRVGVGIYTHPRTQYVHLDVRDQSFHWIDASPPGRRWREQSLRTPRLSARDAAYRRVDDFPEGTEPPPAPFEP